ncbi:unnamed protein product [Owenia fusiformis]|uniref:Methylthioribose-1-phosphate isomerase n=1 Tax=Owenia fusiformis TaxID=6347 RepID=A0A8J1U7D6_OWEFU|nr:unnamed protein product [Owenia fusiformis]
MSLEAIRYKDGTLDILDQLLLPQKSEYINVSGVEDGWSVIKKMQVRGAPAIAVTGCLSLAVDLHKNTFQTKDDLYKFVAEKMKYLTTARPTAVNIVDAERKLTKLASELCSSTSIDVSQMHQRILEQIECMQADDIAVNKAIGDHGAKHIAENVAPKGLKVLTHCNAGALATAGYGTAVGVMRSLVKNGCLEHAFCTETRPYNQGSRLTAYELVQDKISASLICDSMAAMLMKTKDLSAIVVGADRVVANGDTANKIGTYQLAIVAKFHNVPFYIAAPSTTIDLTLETGEDIIIEERPHIEMTTMNGVSLAPEGIGCWNPAFDVTPAALITGGIITEFGVFTPAELRSKITEATAK